MIMICLEPGLNKHDDQFGFLHAVNMSGTQHVEQHTACYDYYFTMAAP